MKCTLMFGSAPASNNFSIKKAIWSLSSPRGPTYIEQARNNGVSPKKEKSDTCLEKKIWVFLKTSKKMEENSEKNHKKKIPGYLRHFDR